jgi:hypothetical protein
VSRYKAAGIHLLLSVFVVLSVLAVMFLLWYPEKYFTIMGGRTLITLIGFVDVFLGPLLTLVVFNTNKKNLAFDLSVIGALQVAALAYGAYVMFESRPVFTVFNKDKFQISAVVDITAKELAAAKNPQWNHYSLTGPELVAIGKPDVNDKKAILFAQQESDDAYRYPKLYDSYANHINEVIRSGKPLSNLSSISAKNESTVSEFINRKNRSENDFLYLPISSELSQMSAIVDAKTGEFIEIIDARENIKLSS